MFKLTSKGDFHKTYNFLKRNRTSKLKEILNKYGRSGVSALSSATPVDTGKTASSWNYKIEVTNNGFALNFYNSNIVNGIPVAILLQYGHGTRGGTYVKGIDYINPALKPIFNNMADEICKEVIRS